MADDSLQSLSSSIESVQKLIEHFDDQGIIIGGVAASVLGKPRLTADTDAMLLLPLDKVVQLVNVAQSLGLAPRLPDVVEFAQKSRMVLLRHTSSQVNVDIALGLLPFEVEAVERSQEIALGQMNLRLPTPEDLIILKAVAHRPKDLLDIASIIDAQDNLDATRIEFWVKQFAHLLEKPELWTEIDAMLEERDD